MNLSLATNQTLMKWNGTYDHLSRFHKTLFPCDQKKTRTLHFAPQGETLQVEDEQNHQFCASTVITSGDHFRNAPTFETANVFC